jgi:2-methylisocitrate lyase-like PEP mutase family enzyme
VSDRRRLRELLSGDEVLIVPGVTSVLHALLAERAGMPAVFTTGAGIANADFGLPDLGLTTMTEVVLANDRISRAVSLPVIADADTGYGNHLNVMRTVEELERAGVAAIVLEDQVAPKKCGHFSGKAIVSTEEMVQKLVAARRARKDEDLVLVARTDAIAVGGVEEAIARAQAYVRAGADVIFVEAPRTVEELAEIPRRIDAPLLVNMVEGGATPLRDARELGEMGYRIVLYANLAMRTGAWAVDQAFRGLLEDGSSGRSLDRMLTWEERQGLVGLDDWRDLEADIDAEARTLL